MKRIILLFLILPVFAFSFCQKYSFTGFSIREGLPNSSVKVLFQDSRGLIWIGTKGGGVSQYDGYSFYTISEDEGLSGTQATSIVEDARGLIWIGTNKGICAFDGKSVINYSSRIFDDYINSMYIDKSGFIWVLTSKSGAIRFNPVDIDSGIEHIGTKSGLKLNAFFDIEQDTFGRFWLVSDKGLVVLTSSKPYKPVDLGIRDVILDNEISAIDAGGDNFMWVGTKNTGAVLVSYDSFACYEERSYNSYFDNIDDNIVAVTSDNSNNAWLGTDDNGIVYIDYPFVKKLTKESGLGSNQITDILEDTEGNVWIGTSDQGLKVFAGWHFVHYGSESGLTESSIDVIAQDLSGNYWCSGKNGLFRILRRDDLIRVFNVLLPEAYADAEISSIQFPTDDEVIFGTRNKGILWIKGNNIYAKDTSEGLPDNNVTSLLLDFNGKIWVGTQHGLVKFDNGSITKVAQKAGIIENGVNCLAEDDFGNIWAGTSQGIFNITDSAIVINESKGLKHQRVNSLLIDPNSNMWIGTMGGGLYHYKIKKDNSSSALQFLTGSVLASDNIYSLARANDTVLVIGTDKGSNRVEFIPDSVPVVQSVFSYDNSNGFLNQECNLNSILVDQENYIWFGTKSGLTCYDPGREKILNGKPKIFLTGLEVNFEAVKWQSEQNEPDEWFSFPEGMKLKHNENYVNFTFSGVYYSESLLYQYFMEGLDKDWSKPIPQRFVNFSKLNPGRYVFKVRAVTKSGLVSTETSFSFTIKPPFWKTWWFITLMLILAVVALIWFIRYRERQLIIAKEILEDTVKKRTVEIQQQKTHIEKQKQELTDSILYAKRIQDAVISKPKDVEKYIDEYFIVFMPRDIVSGDFYWFGEVDNKFVFSVADCTGHGVPGAFMSMLGIRLLNEIVLERKITAPNQILDQLRAAVIGAFQQEETATKTRDGMDMSLCMYNKETERLYFAGAYNSIYLIRNNELVSYKGDRMPVAFYEKITNFTCSEIECKKGDMVYLFSDGFPDQFGGPEQKKYMSKRLQTVLLSVMHLPMEEQKTALLKDFHEWKGTGEQIDDVSLMGIKF